MKFPKSAHAFEVVYNIPEALKPLQRLAQNFRWTWIHETRQIFKAVDRQLWEEVEHNPLELVHRLSPERMQRILADDTLMAKIRACDEELTRYLNDTTWFQRTYGSDSGAKIAYFCAEFGVSESLPIYSGGLGVLAGDHLKAASDLGIPLVAVGLLYSRGYFRQYLNPEGWQQEHYPSYEFHRMPLTLERGADEKPLRIEVEFPDRKVTCQVWRADVGRVPLYLLDSNVLENAPSDQGITDTLYGGDQEMRIRQEMILGIGGMRALKALGISPTVCHMNEGHAAFLTMERLAQFMEANQCDIGTARKVIVAGNVFTTHTPVPAGFDLFTKELLERYVSKSVSDLGMPFDEFVGMGRVEPENEGEAFNMAILAMENANHVNGVSKLHAEVTRSMFQSRWPGYPESEVPVEPITNGIHTMTWISFRFADLLDQYLGTEWRQDAGNPEVWQKVFDIPAQELWEARENQRGDLVRFVRQRVQRQQESRGLSRMDFSAADQVLDPRVLTVGFARRFATYKRATLLLSDRERLKALLFHSERPFQFVLSGKSHPRDDGGKKLIQDLVHFIQNEGGRARMVFLEDYDMRVARALVQGVDVWLNNPRRPMEASGTSGMKVVPNGGLNCSILDGWWDEGFEPGVGWALGERRDVADPAEQDWLDSLSLYNTLEREIAPKFYQRSDGQVPEGWVEMMRRSMSKLAPMFSTHRMVGDYATRFYMPAHEAFNALASNGLVRAKAARAWRLRVRDAWPKVRILEVTDDAQTQNMIGAAFKVRAKVDLGDLRPEDVRVQIVTGKMGANRDLLDLEADEMACLNCEGSTGHYEGLLTCDASGLHGYRVRVVPHHADIAVPNELGLVTWESA